MFKNAIILNGVSREKFLKAPCPGSYFRMPLPLRRGFHADWGHPGESRGIPKKIHANLYFIWRPGRLSWSACMSWRPSEDPVPGDRRSCDALDMVIVPRGRDLGGFNVRRALPAAQRQMVG